jgi:hypothetical protein
MWDARFGCRGVPKSSLQPDSDKSLEKALPKSVLAKLAYIGEPARSVYAARLRELKPKNAREAIQLLSEWEDTRAKLALTERLDEGERKNPKAREAKAITPARRAMSTVRI